MKKIFIENIGLDGDGIINDLDFYQYTYGIPYFLPQKIKKQLPNIPQKITNPYWYYALTDYAITENSNTSSRDDLIKILTNYFNSHGITIQDVIANPLAYDIKDIFGCKKFDRQIFWLKHFPKYCTEYPLRNDASYYINKWQKEGRKIHFITARAFVMNKIIGPKVRKSFENTLAENKIIPDSITYCREKESPIDKEAACKKYNVMVMAEDKVENIVHLSHSLPVVCFDASYNKDCTGSNIIRTKEDFAGLDRFISDFEDGLYPHVRINQR